MTRYEAKKLLPAIQHFTNGGELWYYNKIHKEWYLQKNLMTVATKGVIEIMNIIEDKHFEARKAFALGEEIESKCLDEGWIGNNNPKWNNKVNYRPKPKEPVYEWQYIIKSIYTGLYGMTEKLFSTATEAYAYGSGEYTIITRFEQSKRIRE